MAQRRTLTSHGIFKVGMDIAGAVLGAHRLKTAIHGVSDASERAARAIGFGVINMMGYRLRHAMDGAVSFFQRGMKEFGAVEAQTMQITAITGMASTEVDRLVNSFQDLAVQLPLSTSELLEMTTELVRTGALTAEAFSPENIDSVNNMTKSLVHFAKLAGTSMEETGSIMGILALQTVDNANSVEEMTRTIGELAETMNMVANATSSNARFLLRGSQRVLATAKAYKIAKEEALLFLGTTRDAGMEAMTAGNNLSVVIDQLNASKNTGRLAKILGTTSFELRDLQKRRPTEFFMRVMESLRLLNRSGTMTGTEMTEMFKAMGMGNLRTIALMRAVTGSSRSFRKLREDMKKSTDVFQNMSDRYAESLHGLKATLEGTVEVLASQFVKVTIGVLGPMLLVINDILAGINSFLSAHPVITATVTLFGALLTATTMAAGGMLLFLASVGFAGVGIENLTHMLLTTSRSFRVAARFAGTTSGAYRVFAAVIYRDVTRALKTAIPLTQAYTAALLKNSSAAAASIFATGAAKAGGLGGQLATTWAIINPLNWTFAKFVGLLKKFWRMIKGIGKSNGFVSFFKGAGKVAGFLGVIVGLFEFFVGLFDGIMTHFKGGEGGGVFGALWKGIKSVIVPLFTLLEIFGDLLHSLGMFIGKSKGMKLLLMGIGGVLYLVVGALKVLGTVMLAVVAIFETLAWAINSVYVATTKLQNLGITVANFILPESMEMSKVEGAEFQGPGEAYSRTIETAKSLAHGGVATGPTTAKVGDAGPEAVLPLNRMSDLISGAIYDAVCAAFKNVGGGGTGGSDIVVPVNISIDGEKLAMVQERIKSREIRRQMGGGSIGLSGIA